VRALKASADGAWLAALTGCSEARGQFLPQRTASCDLQLVPVAGGAPRRLAAAVTTLPHGVLWSPEGATLAALSQYDYAGASGTLVVSRDGGEARTVAEGVTFHGFLPGAGGAVAAVASGRLLVQRGDGAPERLAGVELAGSFDAGPSRASPVSRSLPPTPAGGEVKAAGGAAGPVSMLLRRTAQGGGALLAVAADGQARPVAERTGDYLLAPGGGAFAYAVQAGTGYALRLVAGGRTVELGRDVGAFAFSRDGAALAFVADVRPGKQGDLRVARVPPDGRAPALLAREVGEFRWAAGAPRLAWLERYDPRVRSGTAGAGGLDVPARTFSGHVSDIELSPDGKQLAFLQHTTRGGYSVDLGLGAVEGKAEPRFQVVAPGVFGFAFSPDGRWLYYRTRCTRNAEACDVERIPAAGLAAGAKPEAVAQGLKSFEFDPRDPGRLLVTWQRMDRDALDLAVWEAGKLTTVDTYVLPGSAQLLGPDSRRLAYVVMQEKRQGVYVAELPAAR
jgi:dipeptidyl aminopeptidase/acylaminoacyl peptidase